MAEGFKVAEAFVEVTARTDRMENEVRRSVHQLAGRVDGDADNAGRGIGDRLAGGLTRGLTSGSTSMFSTVFQMMASKMAIFAAAGVGAIGIAQQLSGVIGLMPALGFAGAAGVAAVVVGMQGFGDALKNMGDPEKFNAALAKLSPNARAAAVAISGLRPAWQGVQQVVQDALFDRVGQSIQALGANYLPVLKTGLGGVATGINGIVREWVGFANAPKTIADTNMMFGNTKGFLDGIAAAVRPFVAGLTDIAAVGSGFLPQMGKWLADIAQRFADFIARARESGQLRQWIQSGIDALSTLWNIVKNVAVSVGNLAAVLGPPLLGVLSVLAPVLAAVTGFLRDWSNILLPIAAGIGTVVVAMKAWTLATEAVKAAQIALRVIMMANPWVLAATAVVTVVALIIANWDKVKEFLGVVWNWIKTTAATIWGWLTSAFTGWVNAHRTVIMAVWNAVSGFLSGVWNGIKAAAAAVWEWLTSAFTTWVNMHRTVITAVWNAVTSFLSGVWNGIRSAATSVWDAITSFFTNAVNAQRAAVTTVWNAVVGFLTGAWNNIRAAATAVWNAVTSFVSNSVNAQRAAISAVWNAVVSFLSGAWNNIRSAAAAAWNAVTNLISNAVNSVRSVVASVINAVVSFLSGAWNNARSATSNAWNGLVSTVRSAAENMLGFVQSIPGRVLSALGNLGGLLVNAGRSIIQGLINGITGMVGGVKDAISHVLGVARNLLPFSPAKEGPFSGKGWTLYSGESIVSSLAEGVLNRRDQLTGAISSVLGDAQGRLSAPVAGAGLQGAAVGGRAAGAAGGNSGVDSRIGDALQRLSRAAGVTVHVNQTSGSPVETGRMVALALRTVG